MEQWVRVRNEQDHQLLRWLVEAVGEAAIAKAAQACARGDAKPYLSTVCRQLGCRFRDFRPRVLSPAG